MAGKKGSSPSVYKYYKLDGDEVTNAHKICSRYDNGVFISIHKNRITFGKCGLTEFF